MYCSLQQTTFNVFRRLFLIEYGLGIWSMEYGIWSILSHDKILPKFQLSKLVWKKEGTCITPTWTTLPKVSKTCQELVKCSRKKTCNTRCKWKFLNYLVQNYVCVVGVTKCQIKQKYSATLNIIDTKNMILPLDGWLSFKLTNFIIFWKKSMHWYIESTLIVMYDR